MCSVFRKTEKLTLTKQTSKIQVALECAYATVLGLALTITPVLASNPWAGVESTTNSLFGGAKSTLDTIIRIICLTLAGWTILVQVFNNDTKKVQSAKDWMWRIFIGYGAYWALPFVFNIAKNIGESFA